MRTTVLIDVSYLCHRALHSTRELTYESAHTGVLFGFFREIDSLKRRYDNPHFMFCFDEPIYVRQSLYPKYKESRRSRDLTTDQKEAYKELRVQRDGLRDTYLKQIGYRNILHMPGLEADDLIAMACQKLRKSVVIVSSDHDLYQLLSPRVRIWNPHTKKTTTDVSFQLQYGVRPNQWAMVKAIAGCNSDGIDGVKGVGEKTAIKYLTGLKIRSGLYEAIKKNKSMIRDNQILTTLPLAFDDFEVPELRLRKDRFSQHKWDSVMGELGIASLLGVQNRRGRVRG